MLFRSEREAALFGFWISIMSFDAPLQEYQAWKDFFLDGPFVKSPAPDVIRAMAAAILMNPHFLLR